MNLKIASTTLLVFSSFFSTCLLSAQNSYYSDDSPEIVRYKVTPDIKFGEGKVLKEGKESVKELWMDVYYPVEESPEPRPAVILSYGGSFHRGNPRVPYVGLGGQTTTMSQYAMRYAEEGYVCFTITYQTCIDSVRAVSTYSDLTSGFTGRCQIFRLIPSGNNLIPAASIIK